jgi:hypothetical protein
MNSERGQKQTAVTQARIARHGPRMAGKFIPQGAVQRVDIGKTVAKAPP